MSEGELLQIEKARRLDISEEVYFDIITKKHDGTIAVDSDGESYTLFEISLPLKLNEE